MYLFGVKFTNYLLWAVGIFTFISEQFSIVTGTISPPGSPYDFLYNEGIESYLAENWKGCVHNLELALEDWHWWQANVIRCRRTCSDGNHSVHGEVLSMNLTDEDRFFETSVRTTLCLMKCKKAAFGSRMDRVAETKVNEDFDIRKPYDYLQLCYFKLGKLKEAADAAATVLAMQPEHEVMKNNLKYYLTDGEIKPSDVVNRELKEYGQLYILGNNAYNENDYAETIRFMEKSLLSYYDSEDDCRRMCESPFDQGWFPDFVASIANHYTFTLRCKRRCPHILSNLYGEKIEDFYISYFNYLQYAYNQVEDYDKACEAVASFLLMKPDDEVQLRNKEYYLKEGKVTEEMFVPRKDVLEYKHRYDYEANMMDYIETNFVFFSEDEFLEEIDDDDVEIIKKGDKLDSDTSPLLNSTSLDDSNDILLENGEVDKFEL